MSFPDEISETQSQKATTANENFEAVGPAALFGRKASTTVGLTWGYFGGWMLLGSPLALTQISDGTVTLADGTNYIEANASSGQVVVRQGSPTPSGFTTGYIPLYLVTVSGGLVASYVDYRSFALQAKP